MSARAHFVLSLSVLAVLAGSITAYPMIASQTDLVGDLAKIALLIGLGTAMIGWVAWSVLRPTRDRPVRGALAGALTAALIVPLPLFAWSFKAALSGFTGSNAFHLANVMSAVWDASAAGFSTYIHLTKASVGAVVLSALLGFVIAKRSPPLVNERPV